MAPSAPVISHRGAHVFSSVEQRETDMRVFPSYKPALLTCLHPDFEHAARAYLSPTTVVSSFDSTCFQLFIFSSARAVDSRQ